MSIKSDHLPISLINISATDAARRAIESSGDDINDLLKRHAPAIGETYQTTIKPCMMPPSSPARP